MTSAITSRVLNGAMAELVDALVLGTNFFGSEGSSPFRPTKNDYANNYDMLVLSTKKKKKVWYTNRNMDFGSLRKNHTFHLNNTCDNYYLSTRCFFNLTSTTHLWWSCRRFTKTTRRRTHGSLSYKEMFSQCPQKHISPHYNNN
jgi:hypothetical protein